jgi:histidine ammonia-lyase
MATYAARRLADMTDNSAGIVAIELLAAAQGVDLRRPLKTSPRLQQSMELLRRRVRFRKDDREMAPDIAAAKALVADGEVRRLLSARVLTS